MKSIMKKHIIQAWTSESTQVRYCVVERWDVESEQRISTWLTVHGVEHGPYENAYDAERAALANDELVKGGF